MARFTPHLAAGVLLFAASDAAAVDVQALVFGVTTRTPYCTRLPNSDDGGTWILTAWFQDVHHPPWIVRYTTLTNGGPGNMSVYRVEEGRIYVVAEKSIISNAAGQPTAITGVQQYFPPKLLGPSFLRSRQGVQRMRGGFVWNTTSGSWGWCEGDCAPQGGNWGDFTYEVALHGTATMLWFDENYFEDYSVGGDPPPLVYSRSFVFDGKPGASLWQFTDFRYRTVSKRFAGVNPDGSCY